LSLSIVSCRNQEDKKSEIEKLAEDEDSKVKDDKVKVKTDDKKIKIKKDGTD